MFLQHCIIQVEFILNAAELQCVVNEPIHLSTLAVILSERNKGTQSHIINSWSKEANPPLYLIRINVANKQAHSEPLSCYVHDTG